MEDLGVLVDMPSPSNSASYVCAEAEYYLDSNCSSSTSPLDSPYDVAFPGVYPSPATSDGGGGVGEPSQPESHDGASKPAAKRKRENRYKNAPPSVLSRRRAQNRASQRAYRERKDQRIKDLEVLLGEAHQRNDVLSQAYASLQAEYLKLKTDQDVVAANHYQQQQQQQQQAPPLAYDPTIGTGAPAGELDFFLYGNHTPATGYSM
ncbi:hypothetical protein F4780DRAFT_450777 [Xylariomycetidae sp. FL0641]|nr:hypothetical protein F4780DRAFT_450777 [Xylariomycetidae sp. FL0641]